MLDDAPDATPAPAPAPPLANPASAVPGGLPAGSQASQADERVFVVPRAAFDDLGGVAGFTPVGPGQPLLTGLLALPATFRPRGEVEADEAWLQPIPYVVFRHAGRVFAYDRGRAGGEARLHGKWSVGIGGHVNGRDASRFSPDVGDLIGNGLVREVEEEMGYRPEGDLSYLGLIYDDSDAVGRVHLGIAYTLDLDRPPLVPIGATGYAMVEPEIAVDFVHFMERYESWSRLVLAHLAAAAGASDVPASGPRWADRLAFDSAISTDSPCVKGTWVTVAQIVLRIVDGWSWANILRSHPELTEDDIRACLEWSLHGTGAASEGGGT